MKKFAVICLILFVIFGELWLIKKLTLQCFELLVDTDLPSTSVSGDRDEDEQSPQARSRTGRD